MSQCLIYYCYKHVSAPNLLLWQKVSKREEGIKAGVIEGQLYDDKGVIAIGKLPTKKELYAQVCMYVCMCVCVCVYIYICIYTYI